MLVLLECNIYYYYNCFAVVFYITGENVILHYTYIYHQLYGILWGKEGVY